MSPHFLLHGAPGDVMCGIGNALKDPHWDDSGRFIVYSNDPSTFRLVEAQKFYRGGFYVTPESFDEYKRSVFDLCIRGENDPARINFVKHISNKAGVNFRDIVQSQVHRECKLLWPVHQWSGGIVPDYAVDRAKKLMEYRGDGNGRKLFMIHPFSFQSNTLERHWPHWSKALPWLIGNKQHDFVITGVGWAPMFLGSGPENIRCLVKDGRTTDETLFTKDNNEVLAIMEMCDGVITTTNNLSHWAVITDKPIVNVINAAVKDPNWYFRRWYNFPKARFVQFNDSLEAFIETINTWDVWAG